MSDRKTLKAPIKLNGWRSDGLVVELCGGFTKSEIIDIVKGKEVESIELVIKFKEPKVIQMTEGEFKDLIRVVENYAHPVAELKSRLNNKKYHKRD